MRKIMLAVSASTLLLTSGLAANTIQMADGCTCCPCDCSTCVCDDCSCAGCGGE